MAPHKIEGIVAAGSATSDQMQGAGIKRVPLLRLKSTGENLLSIACRCLLDGGKCETVHVLAPEEVPLPDLGPKIIRAAYTGDLIQNLEDLVRTREPTINFILSSADMPFLTPEAVAAIMEYDKPDRGFIYPVIEKACMDNADFPSMQRTWGKLKGLTVTGSNVAAVKGWVLRSRMGVIRQLFEDRKNVSALARIFGWSTLIKLILRQLTLEQATEIFGHALSCHALAPILAFPELGADIDKDKHYRAVAHLLTQ